MIFHMPYLIRTYQDGFIEDQFKIGSDVYDPWPMGGQTRPEQLIKAYSQNTFDPETRFYAFQDEEMVGFLTTSFKEEKEGEQIYYFEFPYARQEHAPKAEEALIEHAIEALKNKGANVLLARAGDYWGKSRKYAEKYRFVPKQDIVRRGEIRISKLDVNQLNPAENIANFDPVQHFDGVIQLYLDLMGGNKEQIEQNLHIWKSFRENQQIKSPWDRTITLLGHYVSIFNNEIVGRSVIIDHENFEHNSMLLNQFMIKPDFEFIKPQMLRKIIETGKEYGKEILIVHTGPWGLMIEEEDFFGQFCNGFETKLAYYEKKLQ